MADVSVLKRLIRIFRTNSPVKHHFQTSNSMVDSETQGTAKLFFKNAFSYNQNTIPGYSSYSRFARYCVSGDTLIAVTNRKGFIRIDELTKRMAKGEKFQTFSYDHKTKSIVCAEIEKSWMTKRDEIWEVALDNGTVIKCTKDHPFMMRDGTYKEAQYLCEDDALMATVCEDYTWHKTKRNHYRKIKNVSGEWAKEHNMVVAMKEGRDVDVDTEVVHHKNFIGSDNTVDNLQLMTHKEHWDYHNKNNKHLSKLAKERWAPGGGLRENVDKITKKRMNHPGWEKSVKDLIARNKVRKFGQYNKGREDQKGADNANAKKEITFQTICNLYKPGVSCKEIALTLGVDRKVVINRIKWKGYKNWPDFVGRYENHKVVSVKATGIFENVYDLTVPGYHNFAVAEVDKKTKTRQGIVIIHNSDYSEMEAYPIIGNALNIVSDEVTQKNEDGKIIEIVSSDEEIQKTLQELLDHVLHLNGKSIFKLVRNLIKYGDVFYFIDITPENGVVGLLHMPANEVDREEGFDEKNPGAIRFRWTTRNNTKMPNAFVAHFRLDGNDMYHPFGTSFLEAARRPYRQLVLLEDAMMVYRITRAPERRVFYLDVGGIPPEDVEPTVNKFNESIKKHKVVDDSGRIDLRSGFQMSVDEDYIIPHRGTESTRIDTLPGGQNMGDIEDVQMIRANLFSALGIPKAFLTFDEDIRSKQVLTQEDIRFARTIGRIQEVVINELVKICMIHLFVKGRRGKDLTNFKIRMTNPSTVAEMQKIELWISRMSLVQSAGEGVFDTTFIYKNFLKLSDDTITAIRKGQIQDKMFQAKLLKIETADGNMGVAGMPGDMAGMPPPGVGGMGGMDGQQTFDQQPMGDPSQVPMDQAQMGGIAGESADPSRWRRKDGTRTLVAHGLDSANLGTEEEFDEDPHDTEGIRRTVQVPMGGRESKEFYSSAMIAEYKKIFEMYKKDEIKTSLVPDGFSVSTLENELAEFAVVNGDRSLEILNESKRLDEILDCLEIKMESMANKNKETLHD